MGPAVVFNHRSQHVESADRPITRDSNAFVELVEPVVKEHAALAAEQLAAFFLNANFDVLDATNLDEMGFADRFVNEPHAAFHFLAVDLDDQLAQQLVEVEINGVLFGLADFDGEFHKVTGYLPSRSVASDWRITHG